MTTATTPGTTTSGTANEFAVPYARLRTVLDGLELNALRYCLHSYDVETRIRRAGEIEEALMPLVKLWQTEGIKAEESCGDGYVLCNGVCVPYNCLELGNSSSSPT